MRTVGFIFEEDSGLIDLRQGDCLELMKDISDGSVDMILCDLPWRIDLFCTDIDDTLIGVPRSIVEGSDKK